MTTTVEAVYQGGVFKPVRPVDLPEDQRVQLEVKPVPTLDFQEWLARIRPVQEEIVVQFGVLPDSTPIIQKDRRRNV